MTYTFCFQAHCHTLFLPATDRESLQHLEALDVEDLTDDYREEMRALVAHIISSLRVTRQRRSNNCAHTGVGPTRHTSGSSGLDSLATVGTKCGASTRIRAKTGWELAALLTVLVEGANTGAMSNMPQLWELFTRDQANEVVLGVLGLTRLVLTRLVLTRLVLTRLVLTRLVLTRLVLTRLVLCSIISDVLVV
jgi:hypothetical protein